MDLAPVGAGATRTVAVQVRDAQLRESNVLRTPITYVPPVVPPAGAPNARPVLVSVRLPAQTATRRIVVTVEATDDRAVTEIRMANEDGTWGPWRAYAPQVEQLLTPGARIKGVTVQVRDAQRVESNTIYTKTTCTACA